MTQDNTAKSTAGNEEQATKDTPKARVISDLRDTAKPVLLQVDATNAKKDDLTNRYLRALADLTKQLARACADHGTSAASRIDIANCWDDPRV